MSKESNVVLYNCLCSIYCVSYSNKSEHKQEEEQVNEEEEEEARSKKKKKKGEHMSCSILFLSSPSHPRNRFREVH